MAFRQAERIDGDGPISISLRDEEHLALTVSTDGEMQTIVMSKFNAARAFALLGHMLAEGGPSLLSKAAGKIKLT